MKSSIIAICLFVVVLPTLTSCQSRGEKYHGDPSSADPSRYLRLKRQLYIPNAPPQPSHARNFAPEYYQPQYNNQQYSSPPQPYHSAPIQYYDPYVPVQQPVYIQSPVRTYQTNSQPPRSSPSAVIPQMPPQSHKTSFINSRIDGETFTTRAPPNPSSRKPVQTTKSPPSFANRFDHRGSATFQQTLTYDEAASGAIEAFALQLLDAYNQQIPDDNFMISPFSVYHLLVMIAEGSGGESFEQIKQLLKMESLAKTRDFQQYLRVALSKNIADVSLKKFAMLLVDDKRSVNNEYESRVEDVYGAELDRVNFVDVDRTLRDINDKIAKLTDGQLTDTLIREDLFKAQLILISGLFFKGRWMSVFNKTFTKQEPFYDTNGNEIGRVNMMFQRAPLAYSAVQDIGCYVIELPYAESPANRVSEGEFGRGLSMVIVLPRKGLSLDQAIGKIYQHGMKKIMKELYDAKNEYGDEEVEVHLPRFEIQSSLDLRGPLEALGVKNIFDQSVANLSLINPQYYVSSMIHKTKLSVDEQGTTAAAVSVSIFANKSTPPKFQANKPFLFFIVDKLTNLILFSGQYTTPSLY